MSGLTCEVFWLAIRWKLFHEARMGVPGGLTNGCEVIGGAQVAGVAQGAMGPGDR